MARSTEGDRHAPRVVAGAIFRSVRQARGLKAPDVAEGLGIEARSYERFEAGEVQLEVDRLLRFAEITESDPIALFASIVLERPELALRCADAKLALVAVLALEQFLAASDRAAPDAATFISVVEGAFAELAKDLQARKRFVRTWLDGFLRRDGRGP